MDTFRPRSSEVLASLLRSCHPRNLRKSRLLACAITCRAMSILTAGSHRSLIAACIDLCETWADEIEDDRLPERENLIRSYDRRQILNGYQKQIREASRGLPHDSALAKALDAAHIPLCLLLTADYLDFGAAMLTAMVQYAQEMYDPDRRDPDVSRYAAEQEADRQLALGRDIFGYPLRPVAFDPDWRTSPTVALARQMYEGRDFALMPILADALQDAGCEQPDVLAHCRGDGPHVRGCWVVDLVLGKG